jgi:two-component system response regulator FixJ
VEGKANKVIAFDLGISPRTVEIYRANVMAKMQAKSLSELVRMALLVEGAS